MFKINLSSRKQSPYIMVSEDAQSALIEKKTSYYLSITTSREFVSRWTRT